MSVIQNAIDHPDDHEVLRSRVRRASTHLSNPSLLTTRFDKSDQADAQFQPLYSLQTDLAEFPSIYVQNDQGKTRSLNEYDYQRRRVAASETKDSEEASSVHKVEDFGFGAAALLFPNETQSPSDDNLPRQEDFRSLGATSKLRKLFKIERIQMLLSLLIKFSLSMLEKAVRIFSDEQPAAESIEASLGNRMAQSLNWSKLDNEQYLPLDAFESILNVESIVLLLKEKYRQATDEELLVKLRQIIHPESKKSRRRIIGILVLSRQDVALIDDFIRHDIWDEDLPLKRVSSETGYCISTRKSSSNRENITLLKNWGRIEIELFFIYQRMLFVPFFDIQEDRLCSYEFDGETRLPWRVFENPTSGGFGLVHKLEIHASHHNFKRTEASPRPVLFALKEIEAVDQKAYRKELSALEKSSAQLQKEKHLIKLLLTFQHGKKFYLLFEWADGNLEDFWERCPFPEHTAADERWAAEQCLGIAKAVSRIHGLTTEQKMRRSSSNVNLIDGEREWGRHGDIKPDNILWFAEYGGDRNLLVVSDLGLTRYHSEFSKSLVPISQIDGCTRAYRPPEMDLRGEISSKYDIWSLGCVFLEFCVWYLEGHSEVEKFAYERERDDKSTVQNIIEEKFFIIDEVGKEKIPRIKPIVQERIARLQDPKTCTPFAQRLLTIVKDQMLCCNTDERSTIDIIRNELKGLAESLPKVWNAEEMSQTLAFTGQEDSSVYTPSLTDMSLQEESIYPNIESLSLSIDERHLAIDTRVRTSQDSGVDELMHIDHQNEAKEEVPNAQSHARITMKAKTFPMTTTHGPLSTLSSNEGFEPKTPEMHAVAVADRLPVSTQAVSQPTKKTRKTHRHKEWIRLTWNGVTRKLGNR
ncbi:kinase-like domain-containing protein [Lophiotrema nucula]|uniref:Kinase-like domain-containing protein n=1 Tax=Lophiotrema nucula TaxID=690887 RepID=A0A6A5YIH9_9PLEO|nr:kinase-like domain-containing protein [Lophiotrema nucula]